MTVAPQRWSTRRKMRHCSRCPDDFHFAVHTFRALVKAEPEGDIELQAALHSAAIVSYARPFSGNLIFPKRRISKQPGFRDEIHEQLLLLRHKLVAHSDPEFAHGRLFVGSIELELDAGTVKVPKSAVVMTRNIHTVQDFELTKAYLSHTEAAAQAAHDTLLVELGEYALAAAKYPEAFATRPDGGSPTVIAKAPFQLGGEAEVVIPDLPLNPNKLLSLPALTLGSDGYLYRMFAAVVEFGGDATLKMPDGAEISIYSKKPDPDEAP
jgi:hypothetical protein